MMSQEEHGINLQELGWDRTKNSGYLDVLKPKITFDQVLEALPKPYTKRSLKEVVRGKDLIKVITEAIPVSEFERQVLGHLTSICTETNHKLTIWRDLDYIGNQLDKGVITVMRPPGNVYTAGEYVGYGMSGGFIRVNGRAKSIGPRSLSEYSFSKNVTLYY